MSDRQFPDLLDRLEWNLVARASYQAPTTPTKLKDRLPDRTFLIEDSHLLSIGVTSQSARTGWVTGGWANMVIPFLPSSTSQFTAQMYAYTRRLKLRVHNLIVLPKLSDTYLLTLSFPYWLNDVSLEIYKYDGRDIDAPVDVSHLQQAVDRVEQKLDQL